MRARILLVGAIVAVAVAAIPASLASSGRNPQIAGLQVALRAQGLYRGPIDAISGPETVAAVRAFQQLEGLPATGLADARTREALGPLGRHLFGARTLQRGAFGWDVAVLQFLLVHQGISVPVNAYFDGPTSHGVRLMQERLHLRADGVVGPHTLRGLVSREPVPLAHGVPVAARPKAHPHRSHHGRVTVHVVRAGESLSSIARHYHTTVARLARLNHLDPSHVLLIGTRLKVPHGGQVRHAGTTQHVAYRTQSVASVRALLDHWALHYGVNVHLVRALAWMESGYQTRIVSSAGARGVLQTLPTTREYVETVLAGRKIPHTVDGDIEVGILYLRHLLQVFHGNESLALAGWYQGERAVNEHGVYNVSKPFVANVLALKLRM